jgi:hypothetical protein
MPTISEAEKQRRHALAESVAGTQAMEGVSLPADARLLMARHADGELTLEEFSSAMDHLAECARGSKRVLASAA